MSQLGTPPQVVQLMQIFDFVAFEVEHGQVFEEADVE